MGLRVGARHKSINHIGGGMAYLFIEIENQHGDEPAQYFIDTDAEIAAARAALRERGISETPVYQLDEEATFKTWYILTALEP